MHDQEKQTSDSSGSFFSCSAVEVFGTLQTCWTCDTRLNHLAKVNDPLQQGTVLSMLKGFWEQHQVPRSLIIPHHSSSFLSFSFHNLSLHHFTNLLLRHIPIQMRGPFLMPTQQFPQADDC